MASCKATVGRFRITALSDGGFALDGGSMFGVVPRAVWERLTPVYKDHTIPLACNPFLVESGEHVVVIEPGIGDRWDAKQRAMFRIDRASNLLASLQQAGYAPEQVTHCLMSHLHWDHVGAACGADGAPVFPNARYVCPESEADAALNPDHLRRASYRREDIEPILQSGQLETFREEHLVVPGIRMIEVGGHSDGTSLVLIEDAGETACFWADVVPTGNHVHMPFIMAFDMHAAKSHAVRKEWIPRAVEGEWTCLLYHEVDTPIGRFVQDGRRFSFAP